MAPRLLFISDLHLQATRADITAALIVFLRDNSRRCEALYILGDLFEAWLGDDAADPLAEHIADALRDFTRHGSEIFLLHGNRDFLIGEQYAAACRATLLPDPSVIDSPLGPILISHGDQLCTDDEDYQHFRATVRESGWQAEFLARPLDERIEFARQAREQSQEATAGKAESIMDVNPEAVVRLLREQGQTRLLHGHTHRPALHELTFSEPIAGVSEGWRLVLGDWDESGWYAEITADGPRLESFPLASAQLKPEAPAAE